MMSFRHLSMRLLRCFLLTAAVFFGVAGIASATERGYWGGQDGTYPNGHWFCADGMSTAEKDTLTAINDDTSSSVQAMDGTWMMCWHGLTLAQMLALRGAVQAFAPTVEERYALSISTAYDRNGPFLLTVYGVATRSTSGTSWSVTVQIEGVDQATQSCASNSVSCTGVVSGYLSVWQTYGLVAVATQGGGTVASASGSFWAYCD